MRAVTSSRRSPLSERVRERRRRRRDPDTVLVEDSAAMSVEASRAEGAASVPPSSSACDSSSESLRAESPPRERERRPRPPRRRLRRAPPSRASSDESARVPSAPSAPSTLPASEPSISSVSDSSSVESPRASCGAPVSAIARRRRRPRPPLRSARDDSTSTPSSRLPAPVRASVSSSSAQSLAPWWREAVGASWGAAVAAVTRRRRRARLGSGAWNRSEAAGRRGVSRSSSSMSAPVGSSSSCGMSDSSPPLSSAPIRSPASSCRASALGPPSVDCGSPGSSASIAARGSATGAVSGAAEAATAFRRRRDGTDSTAGACEDCCAPGSSGPEAGVSDAPTEAGCSATGAWAGAAAAAVTLRRRRGAGALTASPCSCSYDSVDSDVVRRAMGLALSGADAVVVPSTRQRGCAPQREQRESLERAR